MKRPLIKIRGARQHNLKNLDIDIQTGELTVFTGVSGSGKSSLVFDTLFAEGQRRYVETFSAYARQFLDRMDKPAVDRIEGVPPAIAIDQSNPVRSSRSTVGTMTELNDHLKLLFARNAHLFDKLTGLPVRHDDTESIYADLCQRVKTSQPRLQITFPVTLPKDTTQAEMEQWLSASGFTRIHTHQDKLYVIADRFRIGSVEKPRAIEALETALKHGSGKLTVFAESTEGDVIVSDEWRFSTGLHCPESGIQYGLPTPSLFSFNSAHGACTACKGFGRVIGVDMGLVIPNDKLTLRAGAIKVMQTPAWKEAQDDLMRHAEAAGIPRDTPWNQLTHTQQQWVINGSPNWNGKWSQHWFGITRFFDYLESKAYKMHIRVLLSKYRSYTTCPTCDGARLKTESLLWRVGTKTQADAVLQPASRFAPKGIGFDRHVLQGLPGLCLFDVMQLPIEKLRTFFASISGSSSDTTPLSAHADISPTTVGATNTSSASAKAQKLILDEVNTRLQYLCDVGIGYLTLDRQSRTLSGGEVQRINLTTALGTSLVNTLFVLDEPSIGLHPRDMDRITRAMLRLRDAGNTLVVVEHDPAVMLAADRVIDMGPGPGTAGGQMVFDGTPDQLRNADTLTGAYLAGRKSIGMGFRKLVTESTPRLILEGARQNNLKNISIDIPLKCLVTITGVSGSGKSTLVQDILAPALQRHFGKATDAPGLHDRLLGADHLSDIVFVDQSPIGKTARSNPASFVGAWDSIRELFAQVPLAMQRGYTASKFSFNGGDGRCPTCGGSGFEHVEMQFLSDVYLRCQDCEGQRYRPEVLEIQRNGLNVADVLNLTVAEACKAFALEPAVLRALQPLNDVGLDYVKLGQPVPTLSGGEAQRLKLAAFLAEATGKKTASKQPVATKGKLFMFDEPTTGLHFDDIAKLMRALRKLLEAGHSLIIIEHNLDVIRASDWLIDLGPEGGDAGGEMVAVGTPDDLKQHLTSHTGRALRDYDGAVGVSERIQTPLSTQPTPTLASNPFVRVADISPTAQGQTNTSSFEPPYAIGGSTRSAGGALRALDSTRSTNQTVVNAIQIKGARENNLKNLSVNIPHGQFNVITGVSGSGKSTLAFDILFNEGQRRYLESLNAYARSIVQPAGRPEVDAVYGIPPTVAIEQRLSRGGRKSTVGTATEVWHFLRLLYVKLGVQHCVHDGTPVAPQTPDSIAAQLMRDFKDQHIGLLAPLVINRKGIYTELADWARPRGYTHLRVDGEFLPTTNFPRIDRFKEHTVELPVADIIVNAANEKALRAALAMALEHGKGVLHVLSPLIAPDFIGKISVFSTLRACPVCSTSYNELDPRLFSYNSKHGWCKDCVGTGVALSKEQRKVLDDSVMDADNKGREQSFEEAVVEDVSDAACPSCNGTRLNLLARAVKFENTPITDVAALSIDDIRTWIKSLQLQGRDADIARDLLPEIEGRLAFLEQVGLSYLTLDRGAPTLSGGEAQRIRLAAQLGSNLQGVCYVLDEPTIGLHARDNAILLSALKDLTTKGNTLVVVEHDADTIRAADHIIDIGPSAGKRGGRLVAEGSVADVQAVAESQTGQYLGTKLRHPFQARRVVGAETTPLSARADISPTSQGQSISICNATLHNLQNVSVDIPLGKLVAITGVSGSGKSTLAREVLFPQVQKSVETKQLGSVPNYALQRVLEVDQTPIGKTPRSCPATYVGFWDLIRKLFADTLEAKARGYLAARFSFNTGPGRCDGCEGQGMKTIAMSFLPDVKVLCEVCKGARFNPETLAVRWKGKSIGDVLQMEVDEAVEFFAAMPSVAHPLQLLKDVGLGYLTLGQPSPTLSGGEAQRLKLVTELSKVRDDVAKRGQKTPLTLYVLDEPTVGLHMADVEKLIRVLHRLVDAGHSVVVIEHDLDVIAEADWVIDMGPEGGKGGGRVVCAGTPEDVVASGSHTGLALTNLLKN
jgi:excinuclease ABC subunit A